MQEGMGVPLRAEMMFSAAIIPMFSNVDFAALAIWGVIIRLSNDSKG